MSDRYIDQVEKLLALSKSSNPHEAALALKRAHKLMQKYKININMLKEAKFAELSLSFSRGISHREIASSVAYIIKNLSSCYVLGSKSSKELIFIGDNASLIQAKYLFTFLDRALISAKKSYVKKLKEKFLLEKFHLASPKIVKQLLKNKTGYSLKRQTDLYLIGYLQAVCSNLIVKEIMLPSDLAKFVHTKYPNLKKQISRKKRVNQAEQRAFALGVKDGKTIKINKAIYGEPKHNYLSL